MCNARLPAPRQVSTNWRVLLLCRPPTTTMTSATSINFLSASCRSFVGFQTVSANRISALGFARAISATRARTRSIGWVVCEIIP